MRAHLALVSCLAVQLAACNCGKTMATDDGGVPSSDADSDGVADADDACPDTQRGAAVDAQGCASGQLPPLPPDPNGLAPGLDGTIATDVCASTAFLYSGASPTQTGVTAGTITCDRASALRGRVTSRDGSALSAVKVTVLAHPELGQTLSRADGRYDLVVNGGSPLSLRFERAGFLLAQRQVTPPVADWAVLPDVTLLAKDRQMTKVTLGAGAAMQVARGSMQTDGSGSRQATVLFPAGTTAQLVQADGTMKPAPELSVRLTEYTVGANGSQAMPGDLPASSAYTWAAELGSDESVAKFDGKDVVFSQPVYLYLENFLGFPAGELVPVGYYDPAKSAWAGSRNGLVVKVLSVTAGLADLDVDGDGVADTGAALTALSVTDAERQKLGGLYTAGQSLWRVPLDHFSTIDCNWSVICEQQSCSPPDQPLPSPPTSCQSKSKGSVIGCERQTLGEAVKLVGSNLTLHYQSDRVPGRTAEQNVQLEVATGAAPMGVQSTQVELIVAGQKLTQALLPSATSATVGWDGKDAYGRPVQGSQRYTVRTGYTYKVVYARAAQVKLAWGRLSGVPITGSPARMEVTLWQERHGIISRWDSRGLGLGGWTLSALQAYDPVGRVLQLGDGTRLDSETLGAGVIATIAGSLGGFLGDGGPALAARLSGPLALAVAPDGSLSFADSGNLRVRRIAPNGVITTVAGIGTLGDTGDGALATLAQFKDVSDVAVGPDGTLYVADRASGKVRRVGADGIITTVAGNGRLPFSGDDGPATGAGMEPVGIAVGPEGNLYIADRANSRIRLVDSDGIVTTFAGSSSYGFTGDDGPATDARLSGPTKVALGPDGSLFILDSSNARVRKVSPQGIITTVAGDGSYGNTGDGAAATSAKLGSPTGIAVSPDGSLYIADSGNNRVRLVGSDGLIVAVAGTGVFGLGGDNALALQAKLAGPSAIAFAPDGSFYVADRINHRIRRVRSGLPGSSASDLLIPSRDGSEVWVFTGSGRHLRTLHGLTGSVVQSFTYDAQGRVTAITDGDGNATTVERDAMGQPTAIVSPYGQRTTLAVDAAGFLSSITNPAGEAIQLQSKPDGLLTRFADPAGHASTFVYDALGRLTSDGDAAGGSKTLARTEARQTYSVSLTTALGVADRYQVDAQSTGQRRLHVSSDGTQEELLVSSDGTRTNTQSDGTVSTVVVGPDARWGSLVPRPGTASQATGGHTSTLVSSSAVTLSDLANPFSITQLTETTTLNGHAFSSQYDGAARTVTRTSPMGRRTTTTYDLLGRPTAVQSTGLSPHSATYDARGRLATLTEGTGATARTFTYAYDAQGQLQSVTDPANRVHRFEYDAAGRLTRETLPDGLVVVSAYDVSGNLVSLTPPSRPAHRFSYTPVDLTEQYAPPDAGAGTGATRYTYDVDQRLTSMIRPDGLTISPAYDTQGRLSTVTVPGGMVRYAYDATTGRTSSITAASGGTLSLAYGGALLTGATWAGAVAGSVGFTHDDELRVATVSVNGANPITQQYDNDGLLTRAGAMTLTRNLTNGLLTGTSLGAVTQALSYDGMGQVTLAVTSRSAVELFKTAYTYDALGRIATQTETVGGVTNVFGFTYEPSGRLTQVTKNASIAASYTYDGNGNRLTATGVTGTATYDDQDRLLQQGATSFTYSANGELKSAATGAAVTQYEADVLGNLTRVTLSTGMTLDYVVDGKNRRIGKKRNGALVQGLLYEDDLRPIAELDGSNQLVSRFVYGTRVNVPEYVVKGAATYALVRDHLGSVRLVVDIATGTVAQRLDYDAFGVVLVDSNPGFQPFGFAGGLYDSETGLTRFGARDYAATLGRWTAKDPLRFEPGDKNLYGYVLNDPVTNVDPGGTGESGGGIGEWISKKLDKWACGQAPGACCVQKRTNCLLGVDPTANDCNPAPQQNKCQEDFNQCARDATR